MASRLSTVGIYVVAGLMLLDLFVAIFSDSWSPLRRNLLLFTFFPLAVALGTLLALKVRARQAHRFPPNSRAP